MPPEPTRSSTMYRPISSGLAGGSGSRLLGRVGSSWADAWVLSVAETNGASIARSCGCPARGSVSVEQRGDPRVVLHEVVPAPARVDPGGAGLQELLARRRRIGALVELRQADACGDELAQVSAGHGQDCYRSLEVRARG